MGIALQKSANRLCELPLEHPGILDPEGFSKYFELHCYKPSDDLAPFITHIWTQRQRKPTDGAYRPVEVQSGPNLYIFITPQTSFAHGVVAREFQYDADAGEVIAGVKFKPGGFYPFWKRSLIELSETTIPLDTVFPAADADFTRELLSQSDDGIFLTLEALLRQEKPQSDKQLELVERIMRLLETDETLQSVGTIARRVGRSERSLQLLFHDRVGVSLKWVVTRRRLLRTVEQLHTHASPTWTEAAAEQGYSSQSHFTREFKAIIGQLPSQYLKNRTIA